MPKISVILTSFNHEKFIREAIDSVLNQTFTDFELIIWDDASTDGSWEVINGYSDSRIKAFRNEVSKRGIYGINKSISEIATGEYIAIHHSDDVWELDKLEKQFAFLEEHPDIGAVFTNALAIAEDGSFLTGETHYYSNIFDQPNRTRHEWLRFFFNNGNALCHPSVLIRKSCYEDCGLYRYGLAQVGDFDMWIRLCLKHEIHVLPEKLIKFRVRDNEANASGSRPETRIRVFTEFYKLLNSYKNIGSFEDLVKVFPNAEKYYRDEESDKDFALAMIALEEKPYSFTELFGLDILFEVISSPKRSIKIKRLYGFDYMSLIALTAQHDIFFWKDHDVTILHEAANNLNHVLAEHDQEIVILHEAANNLNLVLAERDQESIAMHEAANNLNHALAERDQEIVVLHDEANNLNHTLAERDQEIVVLHEAANNLNHALAERDQEVVTLYDTIINLNQSLANREVYIDTLNLELRALYSSTSWKITKPIRALHQFLYPTEQISAENNLPKLSKGRYWSSVEKVVQSVKKVKQPIFIIFKGVTRMSNNFKGGIDGVSGGSVGGWLVPPEQVYIRVDDQILDTLLPNAPRPDVVKAGMCEDPLVGISYRVEGEMVQNYDNLGFFVKRNDKWVELPGSPVSLLECRKNADALANLLASPPFALNSVERSGDNLVITGILIPRTRDGELDLELRVNGESFDHIDWSETSKAHKDYFWYLGALGKYQFTATIFGERLKGVSSLRLDAVDTKTGKPVNPYQFHELPLEPMPSNLPDAKAQLRVMGWANDFRFWTLGRSHMRAIAELITKYRNDVDWSSSSMLDWGCGCGRMSRHFLENEELRLKRLVGVDIDPVNIQWCKENLKGAEFHVTDLLPPLPFENESFDFIHGNSVFTHLNSENQDLWLTELRRVLKPNGIAVVTVNSNSALAYGSASLPFVSDWQRDGIYFPGHNTNIDEVIDDHEYYTDTFHTHKYVVEHWSKFFEVLAIHEMVFGYQDAVILRKRT